MKIDHAYVLYHDKPNPIKYMEECVESCNKHNIPVTKFKGFSLNDASADAIFNRWNFKIDPVLDTNKGQPYWDTVYQEVLCSVGHMGIWKEIAERDTAVAVFEHDAIVKRDFKDLEVEDNEIVFLGYRIAYEDDYQCLSDPFVKFPIPMFGGTHAYAITPYTAKKLLSSLEQQQYIPYHKGVDWWLGHNFFNLKMSIADPCPVVSVNCGRTSSINHHPGNVANYNLPADGGFPNNFLRGIVNTDNYFFDNRGWFCFNIKEI